jgi:hypothetical protein
MTGLPPQEGSGTPEERPLGLEGLLGIGLDGRPDDLHITRGENFYLYGGSKRTHQHMRETVMRFNDKVDARGKKLGEVNARELREIAHELRRDMADRQRRSP